MIVNALPKAKIRVGGTSYKFFAVIDGFLVGDGILLKLSRILFLLAGLLMGGGGLILVGVVTVPLPEAPTASPVALTFSLRDLLTPTPAFLGTPLPPPQRQAGTTIVLLPAPAVAASPLPGPTRPPRPQLSPSPAAVTPGPTSTAPPLRAPVVPDRIVIPALDVDAPVQSVGWDTVEIEGELFGQWAVPEGLAAGWHNTSAPLGTAGNTVLNGHHNVDGAIFGGLIDLEPGATIILKSEGQTFHYTVAQLMTLQERWQTIDERLDNARWIQPSDDERLTLVTCWPDYDNSFRLIVVAVPAADARF